MVISGKDIIRVRVVDDDSSFRATLASTLAEAEFEPSEEAGPIRDLAAFITSTVDACDAAICDHHLRRKNFYSVFDGAEAVAALYRRQFPAVLCTRWDQANIDEIRGVRRYLPVLLKPSEVDPDTLVRSLGYCLDEFAGKFRQNRKPSRALVRVEDKDESSVYIVVAAFAPDVVLRMRKADLPNEVRLAIDRDERRFYAHTNLGADSQDQLFFERWEVP